METNFIVGWFEEIHHSRKTRETTILWLLARVLLLFPISAAQEADIGDKLNYKLAYPS